MSADNNEMFEQPLMTAKQLSKILGLSTKAIYQRAAENKIPGVIRLGPRTVRFRTKDILRMIEGDIGDDRFGDNRQQSFHFDV